MRRTTLFDCMVAATNRLTERGDIDKAWLTLCAWLAWADRVYPLN